MCDALHIFHTVFRNLDPLPAFPRLLNVSTERQTGPGYRHEGRYRSAEGHCIFKFSLAGRGTFRDGAGEHPLPAGTGFLCRINDPATAYYYPADGSEPWTFVYCGIGGPAGVAMVDDFVRRFGPVHRLAVDHPLIRELKGWRRPRPATVDMPAAESARIVSELFAALEFAGRPDAVEDAAQRICRAAMDHVEEHLDRDLSATELARAIGVSREHLARLFAVRLHTSPYRYLCRRKMLRACRLLKETDLDNRAIAARLGYPDAPRFQRIFKRVLHLTPGRFRAVGSIPVG